MTTFKRKLITKLNDVPKNHVNLNHYLLNRIFYDNYVSYKKHILIVKEKWKQSTCRKRNYVTIKEPR